MKSGTTDKAVISLLRLFNTQAQTKKITKYERSFFNLTRNSVCVKIVSANKFKTLFLQNMRILTVIGLFLLLTDVHLTAATPVSGKSTHSSQQNQTGNHSWLTTLRSAAPQQKPIPITSPKNAGLNLGNVFGNILKGTHDFIRNINPLEHIFRQESPPAARTFTTTTTTAPTTTTTARQPSFLGGIANLFPGGKDIYSDIGRALDSFTDEPATTTTTTTPKPSSPPDRGPLGNLLSGSGNIWDSVFGKKPEVTTPIPITITTIAPPAGGHGRGVQALIFNLENILQNAFEAVTVIFRRNKGHWEPGYMMNRINSSIESLVALKDIYLQRNMDGGIGDVVNDVEAIVKTILTLVSSIKPNSQIGDMLGMIGTGQNLFQNIGKLRDDFLESPTATTTPAPGGMLGNILQGIGKMFQPQSSPTNHTDNLLQKSGEFGHVIQRTGKLIDKLGEIEDIIQNDYPNSTVLNIIGKFKELLELSLTNDTFDNENILDVIQKVWFPRTTVAQIIGIFGTNLKNVFPNFGILQTIGSLLQQEILVNLGLSTIRGVSILRFGYIKDYFLQTVGDIGNELLKDNESKALSQGIDILVRTVETAKRCLITYQTLLNQLHLNLTEGRILQQLITKVPEVLSQPDNRDMLLQTVSQVVSFIPNEIKNFLMNIIFPAIKSTLNRGPIGRSVLSILQMLIPGNT